MRVEGRTEVTTDTEFWLGVAWAGLRPLVAVLALALAGGVGVV